MSAEAGVRTGRLIFGAAVALLAWAALDSWLWSAFGVWREDQATNLWLGLEIWSGKLSPVGLISSVGVPNPNGAIWLGALLNAWTTLRGVTFALSLLFLVPVAGILFELWHRVGGSSERGWWVLVAGVPLLTSYVLRTTTNVFWNNFVFLHLTAFLIWLLLREWRQPSVANAVGLGALVAFSPTLYFGGLPYFLTWPVIWLGSALSGQARLKKVGVALAALACWLMVSALLCWVPYLTHVELDEVLAHRGDGTSRWIRLGSAIEAVWTCPAWSSLWFRPSLQPSLYSDLGVLGPETAWLAKISWISFELAKAAACAAILWLGFRWLRGSNAPEARELGYLTALGIIPAALSVLVGLFSWSRGERLDQSLPLALPWVLVIFGWPIFVKERGKCFALLRMLCAVGALGFALTQLPMGILARGAYSAVEGTRDLNVDISSHWNDELAAFLAGQVGSGDSARVCYDTVALWDWIPVVSRQLERYVKPSPFTYGRQIDWELRRRFGIRNASLLDASDSCQWHVSYARSPDPMGEHATWRLGPYRVRSLRAD